MKKKVFICDDDQSILEVSRIILEERGYEVTVDDGKTIYDKVAQNPPDIILLDIFLGRANGVDIAKRLKQQPQTKNVPIVIITANVNAEVHVKEAGAIDFLKKPFQMIELEKMVDKYLKK